MKIAMMAQFYPPHPGGAAEAVYQLSRGLAGRGHAVIVYTIRDCGGMKASDREAIPGVTVKRVATLLPLSLTFGRVVLNPIQILADIRRSRPELIHLHGIALPGNDLAALMAKEVPIVVTGHGPGWANTTRRSPFLHLVWRSYLQLLGKRLLARTHRIVCLSAQEIPYWLSFGVAEEKLKVIPWGIPEDCFQPQDGLVFRDRYNIDGPLLLFAGTWYPAKGAQWLIRALPLVLQEVPAAKAVLFGGPWTRHKDQLAQLARDLGVEDRVVMLEYQPRQVLLEAYAACDVFVLPTDYEAFGLVLAEAMAFGKAIVATETGAIPYVVEEDGNAYLVPPQDFKGLAAQTVQLLKNDMLRGQFGERSRSLSRQYSWPATAEQYEEMYLETLSAKSRCL